MYLASWEMLAIMVLALAEGVFSMRPSLLWSDDMDGKDYLAQSALCISACPTNNLFTMPTLSTPTFTISTSFINKDSSNPSFSSLKAGT